MQSGRHAEPKQSSLYKQVVGACAAVIWVFGPGLQSGSGSTFEIKPPQDQISAQPQSVEKEMNDPSRHNCGFKCEYAAANSALTVNIAYTMERYKGLKAELESIDGRTTKNPAKDKNDAQNAYDKYGFATACGGQEAKECLDRLEYLKTMYLQRASAAQGYNRDAAAELVKPEARVVAPYEVVAQDPNAPQAEAKKGQAALMPTWDQLAAGHELMAKRMVPGRKAPLSQYEAGLEQFKAIAAAPKLEDFPIFKKIPRFPGTQSQEELLVQERTPDGAPVYDKKAHARAFEKWEKEQKDDFAKQLDAQKKGQIPPSQAHVKLKAQLETGMIDQDQIKHYRAGRNAVVVKARALMGKTPPPKAKSPAEAPKGGNIVASGGMDNQLKNGGAAPGAAPVVKSPLQYNKNQGLQQGELVNGRSDGDEKLGDAAVSETQSTYELYADPESIKAEVSKYF